MVQARDRELETTYRAVLERYELDPSIRWIRWSGGRIRVLEHGSGPPLLLVHGGGDAAFEWIPIIADLARNQWRDVLDLIRQLIGPGGIRGTYRIEERLATLAVPTLFIVGDRDAFASASMRAAWDAIEAANPHVTINRIADAGHLPWMDRPEAVVDAVGRSLGARGRRSDE